MRFLLRFRKWVVWLTFTGYLFANALWIYAWKIGLIKYGCMQPTSASMIEHWNFLSWPATGQLMEVFFLLGWLNLGAMVADLKSGPEWWNHYRQLLWPLNGWTWVVIAGMPFLTGYFYLVQVGLLPAIGLSFFILTCVLPLSSRSKKWLCDSK
jgi:hypothetical protein